MAEALKNQFGADIPVKIAGMIGAVSKRFDAQRFVSDTLEGYEALELKPRAQHIARMLRKHLPQDYAQAVEILTASLGPKIEQTDNFGMVTFLYFPHVMFVAEYGLEHFDVSMSFQYELTQRFTAEFSIRPYLEKYPEATLAQLHLWATDSSPHVRRLVSEGSRPRLPWASHLKRFQQDPRPVLALLELLKDDPELYVRRSVANNLNDIGKDHPELLFETARHWLQDASEERNWLVRHALRSAVKRGETGALDAMGYGKAAQVEIGDIRITPNRAQMGGAVTLAFALTNPTKHAQDILVDLRIHFIKSNGKANAKVFKLKAVTLASLETIPMQKKISLAEMTTRKHYPGRHEVDVLLNGEAIRLGSFELI
ncbi:MAG: hypothetical protein PHP57_07445 [Sideroxydans sp.]|nr:hypothetical protein [Sideroxydans sp.]